MQPIAELDMDLHFVREEQRRRLPHWDPRLWQSSSDELHCNRSRSSKDFRDLSLTWAKQHLARQAQGTALRAARRPSHGRPEAAREISRTAGAAEDGRLGGAGRAQAQRAEHGTGWASKDSLELRRAAFEGADYTLTVGSGAGLTETEVPYLFSHGVRLARVVHEQSADGEPRLESSARQHVFFELGDHLGSTSVVLDKATSELVERSTYQAYGATESDYRPERWKGFREDYGFTGKEEDIEVGLQYFGKRFLSPYLGRWVSADPLGVHAPGEADLNLYAYVSGAVLKDVDPLGLETKGEQTYQNWSQGWASEANAANAEKRSLEREFADEDSAAYAENKTKFDAGDRDALGAEYRAAADRHDAAMAVVSQFDRVHDWILARVDSQREQVTHQQIDQAAVALLRGSHVFQTYLAPLILASAGAAHTGSTRAAPKPATAPAEARSGAGNQKAGAPAPVPTLRLGGSAGADVARVRVRHFTRASSLKSIEESNMIRASDQNSVFTVRARGKPGSPRDVEKELGIKPGKGGAYVEFDARPSEFQIVENKGVREFVFRGNVDLKNRNAIFRVNR